jgi:titin
MCSSIDPPGPPVNPMVTDVSRSTISLTWTKPANNGGSDILGYLVECKRTDATDWIRCNVPKNLQDTFYLVQNLIDKSEYQLRVSAVNKVGFSETCEVPDKHIAKDILGMLTFEY